MKNLLPQLVLLFSCLFLMPLAKAQQRMEVEANFKTGEELAAQSKFKEAIPFFQQVLKDLATDEEVLLQAKTTKSLAACLVFSGKIEESIETYKQAVALAQQVNEPSLILQSTAGIGEIYFMKSQFAEALPYHQIHKDVAKELKDWLSYANALSMVGYDHLSLGQLDSAKWYIEEGYRIKKDRNIKQDIILTYDHLATLYSRLNDQEEAMKFRLLSLDLLEAKGESPALVIKYSNLAKVFIAENNMERAEEYAVKAVALAKKLNLNYYTSLALSTLANTKEKQGKDQEALELLQEGLALNQTRKNEGGIISRLMNIVSLYIKQGKLKEAEKYYQEAFAMVKQRNEPSELIDAYLILGKLKTLSKELPAAKAALDAAQDLLSTSDDLKNSQLLYTLQSNYFEENGQYLAAMQSGEKAAMLIDSLFNLEKSERIHELEGQFERSKKEKEITLLKAEQEIKDLTIRENRRSNLTTLLGLLLASGVLLSLYYLYRLRHRTNERLAEKNRLIAKALSEKEILLKEIHHRVKNNLQVVSSLLKLQSKFIDDTKALDALQEGRNRVKSMAIIHQNLYQKDNLLGVSVKEYIEKLSKSLFNSYNIDPHRIDLKTQIEEINLDVDTVIPLGLILNELLTNALKYAFPNDTKGTVAVSLKKQEQHLLLEVRDNGIGIQSTGLSSNEDGGFGIKLIETFAIKLKGKLQIQQEDGTVVKLLIQNFKTT